LAGRKSGVVQRLDGGIGGKTFAELFGGGHEVDRWQWINEYPEGLSGNSKVAELAFAGGGGERRSAI
jgi:hypothetical protein